MPKYVQVSDVHVQLKSYAPYFMLCAQGTGSL